MRFLRQHQYLLCFLGVLVLASVLVMRQFLANQSAHVELREDFIFLHERGDSRACAALYEQLVPGLEELNEKSLVDDLERTSLLLLDTKGPVPDNPVWKYNVSVKNELKKRSEQRLGLTLKRSETR